MSFRLVANRTQICCLVGAGAVRRAKGGKSLGERVKLLYLPQEIKGSPLACGRKPHLQSECSLWIGLGVLPALERGTPGWGPSAWKPEMQRIRPPDADQPTVRQDLSTGKRANGDWRIPSEGSTAAGVWSGGIWLSRSPFLK